MNIRTLTCSIVLAVLLCVVSESGAATIGNYRTDVAESKLEQPVARQAPEGSSNEDSDEDDEEDDAEQAQLAAQQQQLQQQTQSQEDSDEDPEDDDEDADDDGVFSFLTRRRREAESETPVEEAAVAAADQSEKQPSAVTEKADVTATTAAPPRKSSVLVLIRDALKKVTTEIPTEQVATNALQYFQLFEHFIQQTIEQVIGDDDEEDESTTAVTTELETPAAAENADADKDIVPEFASETNANVGEKPETPIAEAEKPVAAPVPVESAVENII